MDADPWADAPSTPRPASTTPQASPSKPTAGTTTATETETATPTATRRASGSPIEPSADIPSISPTTTTPTEGHSAAVEDGTPTPEQGAVTAEGSNQDIPPVDVNGDYDSQDDVPPPSEGIVDIHTGTAAAGDAGDDAGGGFDDFDDFDDGSLGAVAGPSGSVAREFGNEGDAGGDDDGFGDFGDFEDFDEAQPVDGNPDEGAFASGGAERQDAMVQSPVQMNTRQFEALKLDPLPSLPDLQAAVDDLLSPMIAGPSRMTNEPPREGGRLNQVMVSESSREAYAQLTTAPMLKSLDWTRSRVRREHLISMGVPVNLDEVDSHRLSSLPPLRITTQSFNSTPTTAGSSAHRSSMSTSRPGSGKGEMLPPPHVPRPASVAGEMKGKERDRGLGNGDGGPMSAGPRLGSRDKYGLDEKPMLDITKAEDLCGLEEGSLSLLSLDRLRAIQNELVDTSAHASALLAWLLQLKDAQTQDSATYNGMISELIANAAKAKQASTSGSGGVFRRSSMQKRPQSGSGSITPRRVASPAMR